MSSNSAHPAPASNPKEVAGEAKGSSILKPDSALSSNAEATLSKAGLINQAIYNAKVMAIKSDANGTTTQLLLQIGKQQISVPGNLSVKPGEHLQIRFTAPDTLTIVQSPTTNSASLQNAVRLNHQLASLIGKQWPINQLLSQLHPDNQMPPSSPQASPGSQTALSALFKAMLPASIYTTRNDSQATSSATKPMEKYIQSLATETLIKGSGLFTEATIAKRIVEMQKSVQAAMGSEANAPMQAPIKAALSALADTLLTGRTAPTVPTSSPATIATPSSTTLIEPDLDLKTRLLLIEKLLQTELKRDGGMVPPDSAMIFKLGVPSANPLNFPFASHTDKPSGESPALTTGELLKLVSLSLQRIQFHQLGSLLQSQQTTHENTQLTTWIMELPLLIQQPPWIDNIQLRLEREKRSTPEDSSEPKRNIAPRWKITLAFNFESTGPFYVQAQIAQQEVTPSLWAERAETVGLISKEISYFRDQLLALGLQVGDITCRQGQPQQAQTKLERQLVDIKA